MHCLRELILALAYSALEFSCVIIYLFVFSSSCWVSYRSRFMQVALIRDKFSDDDREFVFVSALSMLGGVVWK